MAAERIPQSLPIRVPLQAVLTSDHVSPATGKTITVTISKNGGAFANPAVGLTHAVEIGSGAYYVDLAAADTATAGPLVVLGTATATDNVIVQYDVVSIAVVGQTSLFTGQGNPASSSFANAVDIGNRACQHCGVPRMDLTQGFAEQSQRAEEIGTAYNKLKRAELRNNIWRFATRSAVLRAIDPNTLLLTPALWSGATTYFSGSIVIDQTGFFWQSRIANNLNNQPEQTNAAWEPYFGPLTVTLYDTTQAYLSGELVYTAAGDGTNRVFLSLQSANSDNPATATVWDATVTYQKNQVITRVSTAYMSLIDLNLNQDPVTTFVAPWLSGTTYATGNKATGSDGIVYQSVGSGNIGHDPTTDGGVHWTNTGVLSPWTTSFIGGSGSLKWLQIGGKEFPAGVTLTDLNIIWPIGSGPSTQSSTRNVFRLPAGYLRRAPQDPSAGSISYLGFPGNPQAVDWVFTGNYIISSQTDPIIFRFIADVVDVSQFDDMFCESLGARIAEAVVEPLTQSTAKLDDIRKTYRYYMAEAKRTNGIELGPTEPELDDYVACRG